VDDAQSKARACALAEEAKPLANMKVLSEAQTVWKGAKSFSDYNSNDAAPTP